MVEQLVPFRVDPEQLGYVFIPPQPMMAARSPRWEKFRDNFLQSKACEVCTTPHDLEAHHVRPYHLDPALELEESNLMALCRVHHFWFGHLGNWSSYNVHVRSDAKEWLKKIQERP